MTSLALIAHSTLPANANAVSQPGISAAAAAPAKAPSGPAVVFDKENTEVSAIDAEAGVLRLNIPGASSNAAPSPELVQAAAGKTEVLLGVNTLKSAEVATFDTETGFQSLISIKRSDAPKQYKFDLELPEGAKLTLEKDGTVSISGDEGLILGTFDKPWAHDAANKEVPTRFVVKGHTLTQVVEHGVGNVYPVIADPSGVWGWAQCVLAVTVVLAGNANLAAKVAVVVKRFGSLKKTMQVVWKAYKQAPANGKVQAATKAIGTVAVELLGIGSIKSKCFS